MAKQWGSSRIGQYSRHKPVFTENRYRETRHQSGLNLHNYQGPYDPSMLSLARNELCFHIECMQDTAVWHRIKRKTDVNIHGAAYFDDGFGEASCTFSHAELYKNEEDEFDQADSTPDPQNSASETSTIQPTHTVTSVAEPELVVDLTGNKNNDSSDSSDCFVVEDEKGSSSVDKYPVLENDRQGIHKGKADSDVIIIDDIIDNEEGIEKPLNKTNELDNNNLGTFSKFDNSDMEGDSGGNFTLKCDLCEFVSDSVSIVQQHLNNAGHFAASQYAIDIEGNMSLKKQMVLQNFKAKFKTILVICPDCLKIFPDIHSCSAHCNLQHQTENGGKQHRYGLIHVIKEEVCDNNRRLFKCQYCSKLFRDCQAFIQHTKDLNHYPFSSVNNSNKIFFCLHCKTSYNSFEKVISHQDHLTLSKDAVLQFAVFHYKSVECHTLLHGASTPLETKERTNEKRKHDGKETDMEPKKKVASTSASVMGTSCESSSSTTGKNSDLEEASFTDRVNNATDSTSKSNSEEDEHSEQECILSETYKCDYCTKMAEDRNHMYLHLVQSCHSSASTVLVDHHGNIMYLKNAKTICYEGANFKKCVAICNIDRCRLLFDSPFVCDEHNIRCHNDKGGYYHIADIVTRTNIKESLYLKVCSVCKQSFQTFKLLNSHYTQSNHLPFNAIEGCNIYILCCYCSKTFSSYKVASNHVRGHAAFAKNDQLDLVVLYVSKTTRMVSIPPYKPTKQGELTSIHSKISNLHEMKKICGKSGRSQLTKQI